MKILLSEAHNWVVASRSKIYSDANAGVLSTEKDDGRGGKKIVDIAEIQRVYGEIHDPKERPTDSTPDSTGSQISTDLLIQQYENRILDFQKQLTLATDRESVTTAEKSKLLDRLSAEQEKTRLLMLPAPKATDKVRDIFLRWIGAR